MTKHQPTIEDRFAEWRLLAAHVNAIAEDRSLTLVERYTRIKPLFERVMWIQNSIIEMVRRV